MKRVLGHIGAATGFIVTVSLLNSLKEKSNMNMAGSTSDRVPHFNLPPNHCSRYVRLVGNEMGENYTSCDAWNRRYNDKLVHVINPGESLQSLYEQGKLEPGMVVGVYNPNSKFNGRKDQEGNPINYTHNIIFLRLENGGPLFSHQMGSNIEGITEKELVKRGLVPKEIIDSRPN